MFLDLLKKKIPFDQYMALALYHPSLGYYSTRVDFGAQGDFVTAPTLTPLFAKALGNFLLKQKDLAAKALIELGPGNGQLAYDLLSYLDVQKYLPDVYYLVETSDYLKKIQQQKLAHLPEYILKRIHWLALEDLKDLNAIVIANEFFDALPVARFKIENETIKEVYVHAEQGKLIETYEEPRAELVKFYQDLNSQGIYLGEGYASECCLQYKEIAQGLNQALNQGIILVIDYGYPAQEYYQAARSQGTLQIYKQHEAANTYLENPGSVDITAHVDFSSLAYNFLKAGFQFDFFTYQNVFLLEQGINASHDALSISEQQKLKRLLDPALMGEAFKVIAFSKNNAVDYAPTYSLAKFL